MRARGRSQGGPVAALWATYFAYGGFWGTFVVIFADLLRDRELTLAAISLRFSALSIVAIGVMTFIAPRMEPLNRRLTVGGGLAVQAVGSAAMLVPTDAMLWVAFATIGVGTGAVDVFVNAAGQQIEARSGRSVLQWVHAAYGAGGAVFALIAGVLRTAGVPYELVIAVSVGLQAVVALAVLASNALRDVPGGPSGGRVSLAIFTRRRGLIAPAVVVMFAFLIEGSMDVWSVIYLRESLGSSIMVAATGFAAFALATTVGRAFAARVLFALGYRRTVLVSALGSLAFATVAIVSSSAVVVGIAFLGLGFALASAAPAAFGMAEGAGEDAGLAVGALTTVGYTGFVVGPPIMGWLADNVGLRQSMAALVVATVGMALAGSSARSGSELRSGPTGS